MILWRLLPLGSNTAPDEPGGALWFPRELQGAGRHDNPDRYGCFYVAERPVSAVAEALAPFRGSGTLSEGMFVRAGVRLSLVGLELDDACQLVDLDSPRVLGDVQLRPSQVATNARADTQVYAERIFDERPDAFGLRWWSTLEASLINLTLYDRAAAHLRFVEAGPLSLSHLAVVEAAEMLGLTQARR
jgi:RES domain